MTRLFPTLAEKRSSAIMETCFEENYGICSLNEPVTVTFIGHPYTGEEPFIQSCRIRH